MLDRIIMMMSYLLLCIYTGITLYFIFSVLRKWKSRESR